MELNKLLTTLQTFFPFETAIANDRIGLQIEGSKEVKNILITFELTEEVLKECENLLCDTIITFHPLIWHPITNILQSERVGHILSQLIKNNINLISLHTTFDSHKQGTSYLLGKALSLEIKEFLIPDTNNPEYGMGVICEVTPYINDIDLIKQIYKVCKTPIKYTLGNTNKIKRIAIVGGSGMSFIDNVKQKQCDAFITADITYHMFHAEKNRLLLIDAGHYETEQFVTGGISKILNDYFKENNIKYNISKIITNPIKYYPDYI